MNRAFTVILSSMISCMVHADTIYVWDQNFVRLPNYKEKSELASVPDAITCESESCNGFVHDGKKYLRAILINSENQELIAPGAWTGGSCDTDKWDMKSDGTFSSKYPKDGSTYSWSGKYVFTDKYYIEDAVNNSDEKEWNEAKLYYLESSDIVIYKGTRSLDGLDENGKKKYIQYTGPDFYYFKRCGSYN